MTFSLKKIIIPSYGTKFSFYFLATFMWVLIFFSEKSLYQNDFPSNELFAFSYPVVNIFNLIITGINTLFLYLFLKSYTIIRTKTFLPLFIFLIIITTWSNTHQSYYPHLTLSLMILAIHNLFKAYKNRDESSRTFIGTIFLSVSSLINPTLIIFFPFVLLGLNILKCFSLKTFLASIMGYLAPWIIYVSILYYFFPAKINLLFESALGVRFIFSGIDLAEIIYNSINLILLIVGILGLVRGLNKDSIQTRNYIYFLLLMLSVTTLLIIVFASSQAYLLPLLAFLTAIIVSHPISLSNSPFYYWYFVSFMATNLLFVGYNFLNR